MVFLKKKKKFSLLKKISEAKDKQKAIASISLSS